MTKISVLIVNYNAGDRLRRCLDHLAAQDFADFETIVVDNASSDDSLALAKESALEARFIDAGANVGFAAGNNIAAQEATGEWLAFLNPDAYARPDWLSAFLAGAARYPDVDAFGSAQFDAVDPSVIDGAGDALHVLGLAYRGHFGWPATTLPPDGECFAPCAAAAFYRRSVFEALGGFDERYFCYNEDVDLGFRLRLAGGRAVQLAGAAVAHEGSGVTGRRSAFTVFHGHRNRIWMTYKNTPAALYWPLAPLRLAFDLAMLARAAANGTLRPYARAVRDGYGGLARLAPVRRRTLSARTAPVREIAAALCWSPLKFWRREAKWRPAPGDSREGREI